MDASRPTVRRARVVGATVTYADRSASCRATVEAMLGEGVDHVVVIDNGSAPPSSSALETLRDAHPGVITLCRRARNDGSASAFSAALAEARRAGADLVWLLDDDNLPVPGSLTALRRREQALRDAGRSVCAVAPTRSATAEPDVVARAIADDSAREPVRDAVAFAGVDTRVFVRRLLERTGLRRPRPARSSSLQSAPYGGLLIGSDVVQAIGAPDESFVLYGDDLEYTSRIPAAGGRLELVPEAVVVDPRGDRWMPPGFEVLAMFRSRNDALLYYFLRNRVVRELRSGPRWTTARVVNAGLFVVLCGACLVRTRRGDKARVILHAVRDGVTGRLGRRREL